MKKHAYRARNINQFSFEKLQGRLRGERIIVAVDVAKHDFAAGIAGDDGLVLEHFKFKHPKQTHQFLDLLEQPRRLGSRVEVVMEPTGTYGDAVRYQLSARGIPVFAVSPKRCHDAAEIFDGVPSLHDAKASTILARLHAQGLSKPWPEGESSRRALRAIVERRELYHDPLERDRGRLEGILSRHWPEYGEHLDPQQQKTALALLAEYPGPATVAQNAEAASEFMVRTSRGNLSRDKIAGVIDSAKTTLGTPMVEQEQTLLKELADQMLALRGELDRIDAQIEELIQSEPEAATLASTVGAVTAAVLIAMLGLARSYPSAGAYVKAFGLNLTEHSSGQSKRPGSGLHISKRAPGIVRKYEWLAVLRLIQSEPLARAWYEGRKAFQCDQKPKAVVALMRKHVRALWHVGKGEAFDVEKMFDTARLKVPVAAQAADG